MNSDKKQVTCSRCSTIYEELPESSKKFVLYHHEDVLGNGSHHAVYNHLCPECELKLENWLKKSGSVSLIDGHIDD
jgi:hypothetical protein